MKSRKEENNYLGISGITDRNGASGRREKINKKRW
jgi:hypothetical protein